MNPYRKYHGVTKKRLDNLQKTSQFRKISQLITQGKIPEQHLGNHTKETLVQELFSLQNTKFMFRGAKWHKRNALIKLEIEKMSVSDIEWIWNKVRDLKDVK